MKMDSKKMKKELETRLAASDREFRYNREKDELRVESKVNGKGISVSLPGLVAKWTIEKEKAIDEVVYYIEEGLRAMEEQVQLSEHEKKIFPVIRSTSFPLEAEEGVPILNR